MANPKARIESSVVQYVDTYLLMVPLFYFASQGQLFFLRTEGKNRLASIYGSLAASSATLRPSITAAFIFTVFGLLLIPRIRQVTRLVVRDRLFGAMALLTVLSCSWAQFPVTSLEHAPCQVVNTMFAFYLVKRFAQGQLLRLFSLLGWICLILSIVVAVFFPKYGIDTNVSQESWQGIYGGKNQCGEVTALLLSAVLFVPANGVLSKIARSLYVLLSVVVILKTGSVTGGVLLVSAFVSFAIANFHRRFFHKERVMAFILCASASAGFATFCAFNYQRLAIVLGKDPTLTGRISIWQCVASAITKRPLLGYGYMSFWSGYSGESTSASLMNRWAITSSHNGILEVWLTLGIVGLVLLASTIVRAVRDTSVCLISGEIAHCGWCLSILVGVLIYNMSEIVMLAPNDLPWILYIVACLCLADYAKRSRISRLAVGSNP